MSISVLIPSRERPNRLAGLIENIQEQACGPVEIVVAVDDDDTQSLALRERFPDVKWHVGPCLFNINAYYNRLARLATHERFLLLGDDALVSKGFDTEIARLPDGYLGRTFPLLAGWYTEFPALTGAGLDRLGWLMPEQFPAWGADTFVCDVYRQAGKIVDLPGCVIQHNRDCSGPAYRRLEEWTKRTRLEYGVEECARRLNV